MVHVPRAEIAVPSLIVALFARERIVTLYAVFNHHQQDNEDVAVLLPQVLYRFSSLLLRIENPYTQWV